MLIMPANNTGKAVVDLWSKYPSRLGAMISVRAGGGDGWASRAVDNVPYAIDNGRFVACTKHKAWNMEDFYGLLDKAVAAINKPLFVTVPDVVGSASQTLDEWDRWTTTGRFMDYGFPLACVAQDGMEPDDIPNEADVVFIGGSPLWKKANLWKYCQAFERVHVGGINSVSGLWHCHNSGAMSIDGTGWTRGDKKQWIGLLQYLYRSNLDLGNQQLLLFNLWQSESSGGVIHADVDDLIAGGWGMSGQSTTVHRTHSIRL